MSDQAREDLAYLRTVTEQARSAPLLGGRFLVMWGVLLSGAYACHWVIASGVAGLPAWSLGALWLAFGLAGAAGMVLLMASIRNKPGRCAMSNVVESAVWTGAGAAIFAYAVGTFIACSVFGAPLLLFDLILAVAFALYGTAFLATGVAARQPFLRIFAAIAFVGAGTVPFFAGQPVLYLIASAYVLIIAVVPGLLLMSREPAALPAEAPAA
ncbi:hypothetical protein [Parvularcula oceani]|uniref:hypothetical protein n=1 Tax=Parvularcula oceani TaxID=1247963 RepID=UPI0004E1ED57|nr:hypothetical protein [Parvularcula oceani]